MNEHEQLYQILVGLRIITNETRTDADGYTMTLSRQLTQVKTRTYDLVYPALKARQLIPVSNETDPGAEDVVYYQWSEFGMSQLISNYADDLPMCDAFVKEYKQSVYGFGMAYNYSTQDIRRAAMSGQPLRTKKAAATRRAWEYRVEDIGATGLSAIGLYGLANSPYVSLYAPTYGGWLTTATGLQMAQDLLDFAGSIVTTNKETFTPNRTLLAIQLQTKLTTTPVSTTGDTSKTALKYFLENCPYEGMQVISWNKLATANAAGTGPRAVMYRYDPEVLEMEIPLEYTIYPPQQKNLSFIVPTEARCGGVVWYYPLAGGYMDGLA